MELATIAKPYAKGAFDVAVEVGKVAEWRAFLNTLRQLCGEQKLLDLMSSPQLTRVEKIALINGLLEKALKNVSQAQKAFVALVVNNGRFEVLSAILSVFDKFSSENEKIRHFQVASAYPLTNKQEAQLLETLADVFSSQVRLSVDVQPDLVGGLVIQQGDTVINGSIDAQLEKLGAQLS